MKCEDCKHNDKKWYELPCDYCCPAHSGYEHTADVRDDATAHKVVGGGERDGATCWFECSSCHGSVDIEDAYCKHCGAVLEYEVYGERAEA